MGFRLGHTSLAILACLWAACAPGGDRENATERTPIDDVPADPARGGARVAGVGSLPRLAQDSGTTVVDLGDGRAEMTVSVFPGRYRADDGAWKPVSQKFVRRGDGGWENRTNTLHSFLPALATGRTGVDHPGAGWLVLVRKGMSLCDARGVCTSALAPAAVSAVEDERAPGRLVYAQVYPGVDEEFHVLAAGLEHDIVLLAPPTVPPAAGPDGFVTFTWELQVSQGLTPLVDLPLKDKGAVVSQGAISFRDDTGAVQMAIAPPRIVASPDGDPHAAERTMGVYRIARGAGHYLLELAAPLEWLLAKERRYPVRIDPTVVLQPGAIAHTGTVTFDGVASYDRPIFGRMVSGTLASLTPSWQDVEGYARFSTADIAQCMASVDDVDLLVWLANHDNFEMALPLNMDIHAAAADPEVATDQELYDAINGGAIYASDLIPRTGPPMGIGSYCLDGFVFREYELGTLAAGDLFALLPDEWFAVGFRSEIGDDLQFDHVDYIGYEESVDGACGFEPFPDSRISLRVTGTLKAPPVADAGGPYSAECAGADSVVDLDGSGSFAADGSALSFGWTTDCPGGTFDDATSPGPVLTVPRAAACLLECTTTLTVSDGCSSATATSAVTLGDSRGPEFAAGPLHGSCLWSPNHKYVCTTDLAVLAQASDACAAVTVTVDACSSDQPEEAPDPSFPGENGDGHTFDDCVIAPDAKSFCVRSERLGTDEDGRQYGVTMLADDGCSPATVFLGSFYVPHDRRSPREDCLDARSSAYLEVRDDLPWATP